MNDNSKRNKALKKICKVCEIFGIEFDEVSENKILGLPPEGMKDNDPKLKLYLGIDQIDMLQFMLEIEEEFNAIIDDELFILPTNGCTTNMWSERPLKDFLDFCVNIIMVE